MNKVKVAVGITKTCERLFGRTDLLDLLEVVFGKRIMDLTLPLHPGISIWRLTEMELMLAAYLPSPDCFYDGVEQDTDVIIWIGLFDERGSPGVYYHGSKEVDIEKTSKEASSNEWWWDGG